MTYNKPTQLFLLLISIHFIIWTLLPIFFRHTLAMDPTEAAIWAQHLSFGYPRDPWGTAWFTRLALTLSAGHDWGMYVLAQVCIVGTFWAVWKLGQEIFHPYYALIAVALLEGTQYYNLTALDLNDNVLETLFWSLTCYYSYLASKNPPSLKPWLLAATFAGLALMTKYIAIVLLASMLLFLICVPKARSTFKSRNFYLAFSLIILICTPHLYWLTKHNFLTIHYSVDMLAPNHQSNFHSPSYFLGEQLANFIGAIIIFGCAFIGRKQPVIAEPRKLDHFDKHFILFITIIPMIFTIALSYLLHWGLRSSWGIPLLSCFGLLLLAYRQPTLSPMRLRSFCIAVFSFIALEVTIFLYPIVLAPSHNSANTPFELLAIDINQAWHEQCHTPLNIVAGPRKTVIYMSRYAPDHPKPLMNYQFEENPWLTHQALTEYGAAFVQPLDPYHYTRLFNKDIMTKYPFKSLKKFSRQWHRSKIEHDEYSVIVGFYCP